MITHSKITVPTSRRRRSIASLALLLLMLANFGAFAENPWTSSSMGWSSGATSRWSSWESTSGGTFGGHRASASTTRAPRRLTAIHDAAIDPVMIKAGDIAEHRALSHSTLRCWRYVKEALLAAGGVSSYPKTACARDAGAELVRQYGFVRLQVSSAQRAPVGSVCVYGGGGAGHVELRTARGFVSDFYHSSPSTLPFIGAYTRLEKHPKSTETAQLASNVNPGS